MKKQNCKEKVIAIIIFTLVGFIFSYPILSSGEKLGIGDWDQHFFYHYVPLKTIQEYHQIPLWNPYYCGGLPLLANPQVRFPSFSTLLLLFFGVVYGLKIDIFLHLIIGLFGMYLLLKKFEANEFGAYFASFLFMLNSFYALHMTVGHTNFMSIVYLPLVFLFYLEGLDNKKYTIISGIFLALMVFEGGTHTAPFTCLFLIIYGSLRCVKERKLRFLTTLFLVFLFAFGFSAMKLLPVLRLISKYPVSRGKGDKVEWELLDDIFLSRKQNILEIVEKHFYGWYEYGAYIGLIPLALFLVSPFYLWNREWPLIVTGILFFFLMLGDFSSFAPWSLLHKIPPFSSFSAPSRLVIMFIFSFSILSGILLSKITWNKLSKYKNWFCLLIIGVVLTDLIIVDTEILKGAFIIDYPPKQTPGEFVQVENLPSYGSGSSMFIAALQNKGIVDCFEVINNSYGNVIPINHKDYKGEYYLIGNGKLEMKEWSPNKMVFEIIGDESTLIINQKYDENWRSNKNVLSFNGLLSVKGTGTIILYYTEPWFYIGLIITFITIMIACLVILV